MRKLRVAVVTLASGVPALLVSMLAPSCGSDDREPFTSPTPEASPDDVADPLGGDVFRPDVVIPSCWSLHVVELPEAGAPADPAQLCTLPQPTALSNVSALVTLPIYDIAQHTAKGAINLPKEIEAVVTGTPVITVTAASDPDLEAMTVTNVTSVMGGFSFDASWPTVLPTFCSLPAMTVRASFTITCADGGTKEVQSETRLELCDDGWVSSGSECCVDCTIIAEMAPSPIVADRKSDDLPLAHVLRLRVLEVARAGRQVLLFAENDAGPELEIEWSVSEGSIERVAPDVVLWTLPDDPFARPFGQVAVWTESGAAVENFAWGMA